MLELKNVHKTYNDLVAISQLSFRLNEGEILGLVGQNGAGKSTTFKMILNFVEPSTGEISINGKPFSEDMLRHIGFLPEERGLYLDMTVAQQVRYFADLHGCDRQQFKENLAFWMKRLQLKGTAKSKIKNLSKGNQQKVQLICTLIHEPTLIILDEPFSGLDPVNIEILLDVILELKSNGAAIIFSSHNMQNVERISDKVLMLVSGKTAIYGSIEEIKQKFLSDQIYVEGTFSDSELAALPGLINCISDYPGKILQFETHQQALECLNFVKSQEQTTGFRLLPLSLDSIFKKVLQQGESQ